MPRILIVDDDPMQRALISDALTGAGYESLFAPDGQAALEVCECLLGRRIFPWRKLCPGGEGIHDQVRREWLSRWIHWPHGLNVHRVDSCQAHHSDNRRRLGGPPEQEPCKSHYRRRRGRSGNDQTLRLPGTGTALQDRVTGRGLFQRLEIDKKPILKAEHR